MKSLLKVFEKYYNYINIVVFCIFGLFVFNFASDNTFSTSLIYWSNNSFASPNSTLFTPASKVLFSFQYRYVMLVIIIFLVLISVVRQLMKQNKLEINNRFYKFINDNYDILIYGKIFAIICLLSGMTDFMSILITRL